MREDIESIFVCQVDISWVSAAKEYNINLKKVNSIPLEYRQQCSKLPYILFVI